MENNSNQSSKPKEPQQGSQKSAVPHSKPMPMSTPLYENQITSSSGGKAFALFVAGLIIGFLIAWFWADMRSDRVLLEGSGAVTTTEEDRVMDNEDDGAMIDVDAGISIGPSTVVVTDQKAGTLVKIQSATFPAGGGWVAIHDNVSGAPGKILGAKYFKAGTSRDIRWNLLRAMVAGNSYFATLRKDDGDPDDFSTTKDTPLAGAGSQPVMASFRAIAE